MSDCTVGGGASELGVLCVWGGGLPPCLAFHAPASVHAGHGMPGLQRFLLLLLLLVTIIKEGMPYLKHSSSSYSPCAPAMN